MKLIKISNLITLGLILSFAAVGCKTKPYVTPIPGNKSNVGGNQTIPPDNGLRFQPQGGTDTTTTTGGGAQREGLYTGWPENRTALQAQTVYFDYDKSAIKSSEQSKLQAVADYLRNN